MDSIRFDGPELQAMVDRIAKESENKITVDANTKDGLTVQGGRTWSNGFGLFGYGRVKSKKDAEAGIKAEWKW